MDSLVLALMRRAELAREFRVAVLAHAREIRGFATYAPNEIVPITHLCLKA